MGFCSGLLSVVVIKYVQKALASGAMKSILSGMVAGEVLMHAYKNYLTSRKDDVIEKTSEFEDSKLPDLKTKGEINWQTRDDIQEYDSKNFYVKEENDTETRDFLGEEV